MVKSISAGALTPPVTGATQPPKLSSLLTRIATSVGNVLRPRNPSSNYALFNPHRPYGGYVTERRLPLESLGVKPLPVDDKQAEEAAPVDTRRFGMSEAPVPVPVPRVDR